MIRHYQMDPMSISKSWLKVSYSLILSREQFEMSDDYLGETITPTILCHWAAIGDPERPRL